MSAHASMVSTATTEQGRKPCRRSYRTTDLVAKAKETRRRATILDRVFLREKRHDAQRVAAAIGVSAQAFYFYCAGRMPFPIEREAALFAATRDPDLAAELLGFDSLGWTIVPRPRADSSTDVRSEAIGAASAAAELATTIDSALRPDSDGGEHVTETELQRVRAAREHAARDVETASRAVEMRVRR